MYSNCAASSLTIVASTSIKAPDTDFLKSVRYSVSKKFSLKNDCNADSRPILAIVLSVLCRRIICNKFESKASNVCAISSLTVAMNALCSRLYAIPVSTNLDKLFKTSCCLTIVLTDRFCFITLLKSVYCLPEPSSLAVILHYTVLVLSQLVRNIYQQQQLTYQLKQIILYQQYLSL